jgi:hypothetical protein
MEKLRYKGDLTGRVDLDDDMNMLGPDVGGRYLAIKTLAYDKTNDVTVAGVRPIMPPEYRQRVTRLSETQAMPAARLRKLFNER